MLIDKLMVIFAYFFIYLFEQRMKKLNYLSVELSRNPWPQVQR